ncbi:DMT family transporter [Paenochrobactrum sp. BZR 201-1]
MKSRRFAWGAVMAGLAFATIWSLSFVFTKSALTRIAPLWLAAFRLQIAGGILLLLQGVPIIRFLYGNISFSNLLRVIASGVLSQAVYLSASYWALVHLPSSIVNIVVSSLPLVTLPLSYLLLNERIGTSGIIAFMLSIVGVMISLDFGFLAGGAGRHYDALAIVLLLASVLALATGNVLVKPVITHFTFIPFYALQFIAGSVAATIAALVFEPTAAPSLDVIIGITPQLAFLAIIGSILGMFLWFRVLSAMSANAASSFFLLTPVTGILFGALAFGESITISKIAGILVISFAIILRLKGILFFVRSAHLVNRSD